MNSTEYFEMSKKLTDQAEQLLAMAKHLQAMGEKNVIPRNSQSQQRRLGRRNQEGGGDEKSKEK